MLSKPSRRIMREEIFRQAFLSLSHVQKLSLNECPIKILVDEMKRDYFVLFPKLEMLIVKPDQVSQFLHLVIMYNSSKETLQQSYIRRDEFRSLAPKTIFTSLSQLTTVVITWDMHDSSIFAVLEILLEKARVLEKMVLQLRNHKASPEKFILALEKVLRMRRASPYAEVIIMKND